MGILVERGAKSNVAWLYAAAAVSAIAVLSIFIMWYTTRGAEDAEPVTERNPEHKKGALRNTLKDILSLMVYKPYLLIILSALCMNVQMALFGTSTMYYCTFNIGIPETQVSVLYTVTTVTQLLLTPAVAKLGIIFDKKYVYFVCMGFSGIAMIGAQFFAPTSMYELVFYRILQSVGGAAYWLFIFNLLYDVIEAHEVSSGVRKDGIIMSYYSFLLKLGGAVASLLVGLLLDGSGFKAELGQAQPEQAFETIQALFTYLPGAFTFLSGLLILFTPLTRKKMEQIKKISGHSK